MRSASTRYWGLGVISNEICNHEISDFWCNISWKTQPLDIWFLVQYLTKSASKRFCDLVRVISHEIRNHEIFNFWYNISQNLQSEILCFLVQNLTKYASMKYCDLSHYRITILRHCYKSISQSDQKDHPGKTSASSDRFRSCFLQISSWFLLDFFNENDGYARSVDTEKSFAVRLDFFLILFWISPGIFLDFLSIHWE